MSESDSNSDMEFDDDDDANGVSERDNLEHNVAAANKPNRHLQQLCDTLQLDEFKDKLTMKREKRKRQKERRKLKKNLQNNSSPEPKMVQTLASKNSVKASKFVPEVVIFKGELKYNIN